MIAPVAEEMYAVCAIRTGTGRCKSLMQKWGFNEDGQTTCECGNEQTMKHLLVCPILPQPCTHEDLEEFNPELDPAPSIGRESCSDSKRRRYVSRQMVPVEACDSAEGFVFEEGPATNSVYCIHYYCCLQIMVLQIRNSGYTCLFSQDFNQTGLCSCCSHCSIFIEK